MTAVTMALFAEGQQGRGSPFSESVFSDFNGLRRHFQVMSLRL
jgi:hypothetical protein